MQREDVRQRIKYLMEHGGMHERQTDWARWAALAAIVSCVLTVVVPLID